MSLLSRIIVYAIKRNQINNQVYAVRHFCSNVELSQIKQPQDKTMALIKTAPSVSDVLTSIQCHLHKLNDKHLLQALKTIFELQKNSKSTNDMDNVTKNPSFQVLCQYFKKHVRTLNSKDAIEAVKILCYLKVPVESLIMQSVLQIIRGKVNELNIREIMFLHFVLTKLDTRNHLVDALKLALPLAFQIHLPLELDRDDLPLLRDMLSYACTHELPDRCVNNIVTGLLLHNNVMNEKIAKNIIWSLTYGNCTVEIYPTRVQLLTVCFDVMRENMDKFNYDDILRTTGKLKSRILQKHPEYYNERFMDAVADYVVRNDMDFEKSMLIARILSRVAHTHLGLVEHLCQLAASSPVTLSNVQTNLLFSFVNCLANNNYIPDQPIWSELKRQISANPVLEAKNVALPWTKFTLELAALGFYEDKLINRVFSKEFLDEYLSREQNNLDYLQMLMLNEAVNNFHSNEYSLPEEVLETARRLYPIQSLTENILDSLARGLGGHQYVVKNVVLPNGIVADNLICLKLGYPQVLTPDNCHLKIPIEKLNIPQSSLIMCIMNFNQGCFSVNSNRLRGTFRLIVDILEKQGYATVPLNVTEWLATPTHERTPYLMREVGYRCGEVGMKLCCI